ncbi:MAG: hypothetical protein H6867_02475 [Rhodospirillales bacterium]|nr:hypothetical protein [Rhodospirillales bacterium]MCB9997055.1 hypothetical protein [Rhodospirillales bacterium]
MPVRGQAFFLPFTIARIVMPPEEQTVEKTADDLNKAGVSSVTIKPVI